MTTYHLLTSVRKLAALLLLLVAFTIMARSGTASQSTVFNSAGAYKFAVEAVQVAELPVSVREVVLEKTRKGYVLKCLLSNNSPDQIVRLDYLLLVIDSNNEARYLLDGTEDFKLKGYATKPLIFKRHFLLEVGDGSRLFLMPNRVFGRESVWEVLKANKALEAHAAGDYSVTPVVVRATNLYDAPPRPRIIY